MEVYDTINSSKDECPRIYNTITLPNGGMIQMDQLAYETLQGVCRSNYRGEWTVSIDFKDTTSKTIETADKPLPNTYIEVR